MSQTPWFDTHAHLSEPKFDEDRDAVVERAFSSGVSTIMEIGDGPEEWDKARSLAEKYPGKIYWAAGIHPYYADQNSPDIFDQLESFKSHPQFCAVGEIGLDYFKCTIPKDTQKKTFQTAVELALRIKKPMVIHCREAYEDLMPLVRTYAPKFKPHPGVIHCFSGNLDQAKELIELGFYLGIDGPLTYPKSDELRTIAKSVPLERLVLETDAPYLPLQTHRGKRNDPSFIPQLGTYLAELRGMETTLLGSQISSNSFALYNLKRID